MKVSEGRDEDDQRNSSPNPPIRTRFPQYMRSARDIDDAMSRPEPAWARGDTVAPICDSPHLAGRAGVPLADARGRHLGAAQRRLAPDPVAADLVAPTGMIVRGL